MPLALMWMVTVITGLTAPLTAPEEMRTSRAWWRTQIFKVYLTYVCAIVMPVSIYSYVFLADWAMAYAIDTSRMPSWITLVLFVAQAITGIWTFSWGSRWMRTDHQQTLWAILGASLVVALVALGLMSSRLGHYGNYAQFHGGYGLRPWHKVDHLFHSVWISLTVVITGFGYWTLRVFLSRKRIGV